MSLSGPDDRYTHFVNGLQKFAKALQTASIAY
jgi:hypothetical protein